MVMAKATDDTTGTGDAVVVHAPGRAAVGEEDRTSRGASAGPSPSAVRASPYFTIAMLALPTLVVVPVLAVLMVWPVASRVNIRLSADRVVFTVGGTDRVPILNSVAVQRLRVERFETVSFSPATLELSSDDGAGSPSIPLEIDRPTVVIRGEHPSLQPAVIVEAAGGEARRVGTLDRLWANPGTRVTLEAGRGEDLDLTVSLDEPDAAVVLGFGGAYRLTTHFALFEGLTAPFPHASDSQAFRVESADGRPQIEIAGRRPPLVIVATLPRDVVDSLIPRTGVPVATLDFTRLETGNVISAIVDAGQITYPDFPNIDAVPVSASDGIAIDRLERFRIVTIRPVLNAIDVELEGIVGGLTTGSADFTEDRRLTWFDTLWESRRLALLFTIAIWIFSTCVAVHRMSREFSR